MPEIISIKCDRCGTISVVGTTGNPALCKVQIDDVTGTQTDNATFVLGPECFSARQQTMLLMFPFSDIAEAAAAQAQAAVTAGAAPFATTAAVAAAAASTAFLAALAAAQTALAAQAAAQIAEAGAGSGPA